MILNEPFQRETFLEFLEKFLPTFRKDIRSVSHNKYFNEVYYLGHSNDLDLQILELSLNGSIDRRVSITTEAFKLMRGIGSYKALVAFRTESDDNWRLSLMTATPTIESGKVVTKLSNPRRFSYLLGPTAKTVTPNKYLIMEGPISDFGDLKQRFSVEVVNNEFYKEIARLYDELVGTSEKVGSLKYPGGAEEGHQFAVRLIGRLVFCWFLREKVSPDGVPLISDTILSREAAESTNYYHTIIAPLFFEILNKPISKRSKAFKQNSFGEIPYLNGGLFSPHPDDYYKFDDALDQSIPGLVEVPDHWLRNLFTLLELYNFTVDENTGMDIDLSIDPEMLGRIFENLLARINPETGETVRKTTGSFYTPREIVDYMVDESLVQYLHAKIEIKDEKLRALVSYDLEDDENYPLNGREKHHIVSALSEVKVLDPACGSGAFPIGVLQKVVFVLQQIDPDAKKWFEKQIENTAPEVRRLIEREFENKNFDYIRKLGVIRESIFGVDIQPIATEIARLRCFLTLIVDERIDDEADNRGVYPLPNLDFKFVTADTLLALDVPKYEMAQQGLFEDQSGIAQLKQLRDDYFNSQNAERESLKLQFLQAQKRMLQKMIANHSHGISEITQKLSAWDPFTLDPTDWFDSEWMFGINTGFNIVIGNPPYIGFHGIEPQYKDIYKSNFAAANGKYDLYVLFIEKGYYLLKNGGFFIYICPTAFAKRDYGKAIRKFILGKTSINEFVDFEHSKIFAAALNYTGIFSFTKRKSDQNLLRYRNVLNGESIQYPQNDLDQDAWVFVDQQARIIINKIKKQALSLSKISNISEGIVTGLNDLYLLEDDEIIKKGYETNYFYPCYRGKEVNKWSVSKNAESVFYPYTESNSKTVCLDETVLLQTSPKYMGFLASNKEKIDRRKYFKKSSKNWYELWNQRSIRNFTPRKILTPELAESNNFTIAEAGTFYGDTVCGIVINEKFEKKIQLEYLLALLNSKLIEWFYKKTTVPKASGFFIYKVMFLNDLPIRIADEEKQKAISALAREITKFSKTGDIVRANKLETKLNEEIYEIYGLTQEEIGIVESATKQGQNVSI